MDKSLSNQFNEFHAAAASATADNRKEFQGIIDRAAVGLSVDGDGEKLAKLAILLGINPDAVLAKVVQAEEAARLASENAAARAELAATEERLADANFHRLALGDGPDAAARHRADEAVAVLVFGDLLDQAALLRCRGWRAAQNGWFLGDSGIVPTAPALRMVIEKDLGFSRPLLKGVRDRAHDIIHRPEAKPLL